MNVKELATLIDGEIRGDENAKITGVAGLDTAKKYEISYLDNERFLNAAKSSGASCIITKKSFAIEGKINIFVEYPVLSFIKIVNYFHPPEMPEKGISKYAIIEDDVTIEENVYIGPYVTICSGVKVGKNARIYPFTYIGKNCEIGNDVILKASTTINGRTLIGDRVIVHPGAVLGSDGYAYATVEKKHHKIPQIGIVVIEDDCEIGANVTIDRASFGKTIIRRGTKIDNLVQVGHNVTIGEDSLIIAQVGIAGSCKIGNGVILAGQVGVADHLEIGDGAIVAAQGGVTKNIPPHALYSGYPARDHSLARRIYAASLRLPELLKRVKQIEKNLEKIEKKIESGKENP